MGQGDYILGTRQIYLYKVGIREPRIPTDHRMVLGELIGEEVRRHHRYCKEQAIWNIAETRGGPLQEGDSHSSDLKRMVKYPPPQKTRTAASWISDETWRLADRITELVQTHTEKQQSRRAATRRFQASQREDRRCRVSKEGEEIESLVENDQLREVWSKIQRCYREAKGHLTTPAIEGL